MGSPTSRSLAYLRRKGQTAAVVEKRIAWPKPQGTTIDLFGFGDVISFDMDAVTITQTTSAANVQSRIKKTLANPIAKKWLDGRGRRIEVHGWAKRCWILASGERAATKRWTISRYFILLHAGHISVANPEADE